jgi:hypothetical protein
MGDDDHKTLTSLLRSPIATQKKKKDRIFVSKTVCGGARVLISMVLVVMMMVEEDKRVVKSETLDPESERSKIALQCAESVII